ncbi:MAG: hypothetical protein QME05_04660 [Candidatus Margulisbacteria bacterium]|nr:hypothetical protein [Candidatus Margulisiibacteriota bacterium]
MDASVSVIGRSTANLALQGELALSQSITPREFREYIRINGSTPEVKAFLLAKLKCPNGIEEVTEYLQVYLQECGYDETVQELLITAKGTGDYQALIAEAIKYAAALDNPEAVFVPLAEQVIEDNPALVDMLSRCLTGGDPEVLLALKFYRQYFKSQGKTNIVHLLDYKCRKYLTDDLNFFSIIGAEDVDGNGLIELSEPGYIAQVDANQDQVIDLSEVILHILDESSDPIEFYQAVRPLRDSVLFPFLESFYAAEGSSPARQKEAFRYLAALRLIIEGDFPAEIKEQTSWYVAEYLAAKAVSEGKYEEALSIYERFAGQYDKTPGGYYEVLAENSEHLEFLEKYYSISDAKARGYNGTHFLRRTLYGGHYFEQDSFEVRHIGRKEGVDAEFLQELAAHCQPKDISFSPEIPTETLSEYSIEDTFTVDFPFCPEFIRNSAGKIIEKVEICYNLETHLWQVRIPIIDLIGQAQGNKITLKFAFNEAIVPEGEKAPVIEIPIIIIGMAQLPMAAPASSTQFYAMMGQTLSEGTPIDVYYAVAPDKDAAMYFGHSSLNMKEIAGRFLRIPYFVIDAGTEDGKVKTEKMKKELPNVIASGRQAIEEYFRANVDERELLRLLRLGDRLIGGPLGIFDYYRQYGYSITEITYPENGDCLVQLGLERRIPISQLRGEMKTAFDALPEEMKQKYRAEGGLLVKMQVEFYNTTDAASLAVGRHLAGKEEEIVTFQTHCYHVGPRDRYQEEGIYPAADIELPIAYFGNHCYGSQDLNYLSQLGTFYYPVATYDKTTANARINLEVVDALLLGGNPVSDARSAFSNVVPKGVSASAVYKFPVPENASALSLYADSDRDGIPDPIDRNDLSEIIFDPIRNEIHVNGVAIKPGNAYYNYFLQKLEETPAIAVADSSP